MGNKIVIFALVSWVLYSCGSQDKTLPYLGRTTTDEEGKVVQHQIPDFSFINQFGDTLTQADFDNKIYVADFFFTSCPTICPVMKSQMIRVYEKYKDNDDFRILSHTIDPYHDSVSVLRNYAEALGIRGDHWNFVTGDQDKIYKIGQEAYMVAAAEDTLAAEETGGYIHSGAFILVDKNRHVRGIYDGTVEEEVDKLMADIDLLFKEENEK